MQRASHHLERDYLCLGEMDGSSRFDDRNVLRIVDTVGALVDFPS